ncbi:MAG: hypothetical protein ACREA8_06290 [Nitrosotalea sp.]
MTLSIIMITYFQINLVNADSTTISFDQNTYKVGDTATITVNDPNLDTDNNLVVIYSSVLPVGTLSNPQDPVTDTIGQAGLGTYSDGTPIGMMFDIQWGQQDRRWSNSDVPTNKITASCWGGANSNTGTPGSFATGLAASGFFLAETAAGSGVFQGTFEIPDLVCLAPAGTTGGPGVSTAVVGMNIKASYYFRDESGKLVEVSDNAGIRGNCCGVKQVFVSTDKYVYMPGDVVSIKGKSYLNDTDAKISLEKNGKIPVITKDIPINKNGTFYANFTIPFDTTARSWWLATTVGGGTMSQGIHFKSESIPPLDQFWSGISPNDTLCKPNLTLIFKTTGGSPACVKPDTAQILIERGWGILTTTSIHDTPNQEMNGTLSGNVVRAGGPRSGQQVNYEVDVYASDGITMVGKTFSDARGNYSIQLPAGNYIVYAPDYPIRQTHYVSVIPGESAILNIAYGTDYK